MAPSFLYLRAILLLLLTRAFADDPTPLNSSIPTLVPTTALPSPVPSARPSPGPTMASDLPTPGPTARPTAPTAAPSVVPTMAPTGLSLCGKWSLNQTNTDTFNDATCGVKASAGQQFTVSMCSALYPAASCTGQTVIRVFTASGVEVVYDDTGTGAGAPAQCSSGGNVCAQVRYTVPAGTPDQTYIIREGCRANFACSGQAAVTGALGISAVTFAPTIAPSSIPTPAPSAVPTTALPTMKPTRQPSGQPTRQPSGQPTRQPSSHPSSQPNGRPSRRPSAQPSAKPSRQPTSRPSRLPTRQPTTRPSSHPTGQPSLKPSRQPSRQPTSQPSRQPSGRPSRQPSRRPTGQPSRQPSGQPSRQPTGRPSFQPSSYPTLQTCTNGSYIEGAPINTTHRGKCTKCQLGKFTNHVDLQACYSCPLGKYTDKLGSKECTSCKPGTFAGSVGSSECKPCKEGTSASSPGLSECTPCELGKYASSPGLSECTPCELGKYASSKQLSECKPCAIQFYADTIAQSECKICGGGMTTPTEGSTSANQCLSPKTNFILGFMALASGALLGGIYIVAGRFRFAAYIRRERVVELQVQQFNAFSRSIEEADKALISFSNNQKQLKRIEAIMKTHSQKVGVASPQEENERFEYVTTATIDVLKILVFLVLASSVYVIASMVIFASFILRVYFQSLIIFKELDNWHYFQLREYEAVILEMTNQLKLMLIGFPEVFKLPLFLLIEGIQAIFNLLQNIHIDLSGIGVTCKGAQAPFQLLINIAVLGAVILVIQSDMQLFRGLVFSNTMQKFNFHVLSREYRLDALKGRPWFLAIDWWLQYYMFLLSLTLVQVLYLVINFGALLQFAMSFVRTSSVWQSRGIHEYSETCNSVPGAVNFDYYLAFGSSLVSYALFVPVLYEISKVLVPFEPSTIEDEKEQSKSQESSGEDKLGGAGGGLGSYMRRASITIQRRMSVQVSESRDLLSRKSMRPKRASLLVNAGEANPLQEKFSVDGGGDSSVYESKAESQTTVVSIISEQPPSDEAEEKKAANLAEAANTDNETANSAGPVSIRGLFLPPRMDPKSAWPRVLVTIFSPDLLITNLVAGVLSLLKRKVQEENKRLKDEASSSEDDNKGPKISSIIEEGDRLSSTGSDAGKTSFLRKTVSSKLSKSPSMSMRLHAAAFSFLQSMTVTLKPYQEGSEEAQKWETDKKFSLLPSFFELLQEELFSLCNEWAYFEPRTTRTDSYPFLAYVFCFILFVVPLGHIFTDIGRACFVMMCMKYVVFLRTTLGYWDNYSYRAFGVDKRFKEMTGGHVAVPSADGEKEKEEKEKNAAKEDEDETDKIRVGYTLSAIIAPRAVLLQRIPFMVVLSAFAIYTCGTPTLVQSNSSLEACIMPFFVWDAFHLAAKELRPTKYHGRVWMRWVIGVSIFILESRFVQFCFNSFLVFLSIFIIVYKKGASNFVIYLAVGILLPFAFAYSLRLVVVIGQAIDVKDFSAIGGRNENVEFSKAIQAIIQSKACEFTAPAIKERYDELERQKELELKRASRQVHARRTEGSILSSVLSMLSAITTTSNRKSSSGVPSSKNKDSVTNGEIELEHVYKDTDLDVGMMSDSSKSITSRESRDSIIRGRDSIPAAIGHLDGLAMTAEEAETVTRKRLSVLAITGVEQQNLLQNNNPLLSRTPNKGKNPTTPVVLSPGNDTSEFVSSGIDEDASASAKDPPGTQLSCRLNPASSSPQPVSTPRTLLTLMPIAAQPVLVVPSGPSNSLPDTDSAYSNVPTTSADALTLNRPATPSPPLLDELSAGGVASELSTVHSSSGTPDAGPEAKVEVPEEQSELRIRVPRRRSSALLGPRVLTIATEPNTQVHDTKLGGTENAEDEGYWVSSEAGEGGHWEVVEEGGAVAPLTPAAAPEEAVAIEEATDSSESEQVPAEAEEGADADAHTEAHEEVTEEEAGPPIPIHPPLPRFWTATWDPACERFYYLRDGYDETTWETPGLKPHWTIGGWTDLTPWYFNTVTEEKTWEAPVFSPHQEPRGTVLGWTIGFTGELI